MNFNIWTAKISVAFKIIVVVVGRDYRLSNFWLAKEVK
jgi:hypothetical protein